MYNSFVEDEAVMDMALAANKAYNPRLSVIYVKGIDRLSHVFWKRLMR